MTWPTHALLGLSALWLLAPHPPLLGGYDIGTLAACAAFGQQQALKLDDASRAVGK